MWKELIFACSFVESFISRSHSIKETKLKREKRSSHAVWERECFSNILWVCSWGQRPSLFPASSHLYNKSVPKALFAFLSFLFLTSKSRIEKEEVRDDDAPFSPPKPFLKRGVNCTWTKWNFAEWESKAKKKDEREREREEVEEMA